MKHFAQHKGNERELLFTSEQKNENCAYTYYNEDNDSSSKGENDNVFAFSRSIPENSPATNRGMSEVEKRSLDAANARSEHEIFSAN